jgi:hypothetical protein
MSDPSAPTASSTPAFEKLGLFYIGRRHDVVTGRTVDEPVLYDSRDLVTHAVCVGMTGSGKTGLCLGLIEEAAIDGVPVLAIDPKGDLGNLLLTFPRLSPEEFRPWVDEDEARRAGVSVDAFATEQAKTWAAGLQSWGQDAARVQRLRDAAEFAIFTPGARSRSRARSRLPRSPNARTRSCSRSGPAAWRRARWCSPASTRRPAAVSTASWPPS